MLIFKVRKEGLEEIIKLSVYLTTNLIISFRLLLHPD